jgi:hypothetical protein
VSSATTITLRTMGSRRALASPPGISGLESLLRELHGCAGAEDAAALVADAMPAITGADAALLFLATPDGIVSSGPGAERWRRLATGALAAGCPRSELGGGDGVDAVALPLPGVPHPVGALVLVPSATGALGERALSLVKLFADHAAAPLRRLAA